MSQTLNVAVVQQAAWPDKARSLAESEAGIRTAASQGAQLVLLQELHATHYFCQYEDPALFDLAEPLDGPTGDLVILDLADEGNYVAVRPSGTEPKIKLYVFTKLSPQESADVEAASQSLSGRLERLEKDEPINHR